MACTRYGASTFLQRVLRRSRNDVIASVEVGGARVRSRGKSPSSVEPAVAAAAFLGVSGGKTEQCSMRPATLHRGAVGGLVSDALEPPGGGFQGFLAVWRPLRGRLRRRGDFRTRFRMPGPRRRTNPNIDFLSVREVPQPCQPLSDPRN